MSRQPNRARSRRVVLVVAVFLTVAVMPGDEDCADPAPLATAGVLATLAPLPRVAGAIGRALALFSQSGKEIEGECAPVR